MRGYLGVTGGIIGLGCLLAVLAGTAGGASNSKRVVFLVTLEATVTKDWNTVTEATVDGCPRSTRATGHWAVTLRSARPTRVVVTVAAKRVYYSPTLLRSVSGELVRTGSQTIRTLDPCPNRTIRAGCARARRSVSGGRFRFYRSAQNEIAFRPTVLPQAQTSCRAESAIVRAIRPGLQRAQGAVAEEAFADSRVQGQTATGSSEVTTELDAAESGRVLERVRWALTFKRSRN